MEQCKRPETSFLSQGEKTKNFFFCELIGNNLTDGFLLDVVMLQIISASHTLDKVDQRR